MILAPSLEVLQPELLSRKTRKPLLCLQNPRYRKSTYLPTPQLCYCHRLERDSVLPGAGVRLQGLFRFPVGRGRKCGLSPCFIHLSPVPPPRTQEHHCPQMQTKCVCVHMHTCTHTRTHTCAHTHTCLSLLSPSPPPTPRVTERRHWPPDCQMTRKR